jgi:hypothetical protein
MPFSESTPILTVYRSGLVNLNAAAAELTLGVHYVNLESPDRARDVWRLSLVGGRAKLVGRRDRCSIRFRAPQRARELYRSQDDDVDGLAFVLQPDPKFACQYRLVPTVQHF